MREFIDFMKELLMLKQEENKVVGLTGFKKSKKNTRKRVAKKVQKEVKLSDLMRRSSRTA